MKPYFLFKGVCELAEELNGGENIYLGIRPYGFHAGNMSTLVVYPLLLCKQMTKLGKIPRFNFFIFINDWEQERLDGVDPKLYPFNIIPRYTTWQYVPDPIDNRFSIVDYWEPIILGFSSSITRYYPWTTIRLIRNSSMKTDPVMKRCLLQTIKHPEIVLKILKENSNRATLKKAIYASAVCPKCHAARGYSEIETKDTVIHNCSCCHKISKGKYEEFEYWFYHKPLALPRIEVFNIDLCITGSDHYQEGDYVVRQKLMDAYHMKNPYPKTLYTPTILGRNNKIMGKSKGNAEMVNLDMLLQLISNNPSSEEIQIPDNF